MASIFSKLSDFCQRLFSQRQVNVVDDQCAEEGRSLSSSSQGEPFKCTDFHAILSVRNPPMTCRLLKTIFRGTNVAIVDHGDHFDVKLSDSERNESTVRFVTRPNDESSHKQPIPRQIGFLCIRLTLDTETLDPFRAAVSNSLSSYWDMGSKAHPAIKFYLQYVLPKASLLQLAFVSHLSKRLLTLRMTTVDISRRCNPNR